MPEIRATEALLRIMGVIATTGFMPTNPYAFFRCIATDTGRRFYLPLLPGVLGKGASGRP